jgi:hypothetical protein
MSEGAVFRSLDKFQRLQPRRLSDKAVARIVKRRAAVVGLDPDRYAAIHCEPARPPGPKLPGPRRARSWPLVAQAFTASTLPGGPPR